MLVINCNRFVGVDVLIIVFWEEWLFLGVCVSIYFYVFNLCKFFGGVGIDLWVVLVVVLLGYWFSIFDNICDLGWFVVEKIVGVYVVVVGWFE